MSSIPNYWVNELKTRRCRTISIYKIIKPPLFRVQYHYLVQYIIYHIKEVFRTASCCGLCSLLRPVLVAAAAGAVCVAVSPTSCFFLS